MDLYLNEIDRNFHGMLQVGKERQRFDFDDFDGVPQKFNIWVIESSQLYVWKLHYAFVFEHYSANVSFMRIYKNELSLSSTFTM